MAKGIVFLPKINYNDAYGINERLFEKLK